MPERIRLRRTKGWRLPEGARSVARPTRWGNPFRVGEVVCHHHRSAAHPFEMYLDTYIVATAVQAVGLYRKIVTDPGEHRYDGFTAPTVDEIVAELAGLDLACWCPLTDHHGRHVACHADVLLELANP